MGPILYTANFDATAITAAADIFECTPAVDRPILVWGLSLLNTSDLGDANEETLKIGVYRKVTAGSGGTALTEVVYTNVSAAASPTCAMRTAGTASTAGTLIDIIGWNVRIPLLWVPIPDMRPHFTNITAEGPTSSFRLIAAPADSITVSGCIYWEEV